MLRTVCRWGRNHRLVLLLCLLIAQIIPAAIILNSFCLNENEFMMGTIAVSLGILLSAAQLGSMVIHYADMRDYMDKHPLMEAKEAWEKTKDTDDSDSEFWY